MRLVVLTLTFVLTTLSVFAAPAKSDAAVEAEIRARLAKSKIAVNGFSVRVQNGTATWTGTTDVVQHKGAATRMAKSCGALRVDNRITIGARARLEAAQKLHRTDRSASRGERVAPSLRVADTAASGASAPAPTVAPTLAPPPVRRAVVRRP